MVRKIGNRELRSLGLPEVHEPANENTGSGHESRPTPRVEEVRAAVVDAPNTEARPRSSLSRHSGAVDDGASRRARVRGFFEKGALSRPQVAVASATITRVEAGKAPQAEPDEGPQVCECTVCGDEFLVCDFPQLAGCTHEADVCRECFSGWVEAQMKVVKDVTKITCPAERCATAISQGDVEKYADLEVSERYDRLNNLTIFSEVPGFKLCNGGGCRSGQIHDPGTTGDHIFRCTSCDFRMCVNHGDDIADGVPMHDGESCDAYKERLEWQQLPDAEQESLSRGVIEKESVLCPGEDCGYSIQKSEGCDHMTCSQCSYEFCYICRAPYRGEDGIWGKKGNAAHEPNCRYHSGNLHSHPDEEVSDDESEENEEAFFREEYENRIQRLADRAAKEEAARIEAPRAVRIQAARASGMAAVRATTIAALEQEDETVAPTPATGKRARGASPQGQEYDWQRPEELKRSAGTPDTTENHATRRARREENYDDDDEDLYD
ncbi:hypothetical protein NX059_001285 [Plenodomus lindquistii]|nr:hypothetical protein NX059_001285 [Plenodomus lindquistii]